MKVKILYILSLIHIQRPKDKEMITHNRQRWNTLGWFLKYKTIQKLKCLQHNKTQLYIHILSISLHIFSKYYILCFVCFISLIIS